MKKERSKRLPGFFEKNIWSRYPGIIAGIIILVVAGLILYWRQVPRDKGLANLSTPSPANLGSEEKKNEETSLTPATKEVKEQVEKSIPIIEPSQAPILESQKIATSPVMEGGKGITVKALKGQGITHLARASLQKYLDEQKPKISLSKEHKIFIEDFLKDASAKKRLYPETELTFSFELIDKAIAASQRMTPAQLAGLARYSQKVPSLATYMPVT